MGEKRQEIADKETGRQTEKAEDRANEVSNDENRWGNGNARITRIEILDDQGEAKTTFRTGSDIRIRLHYKVKKTVKNAMIGIAVYRSDGIHCYGTNTRIDRLERFSLEKDGMAELFLKKANLLQGKYFLDFAIESEDGQTADYYKGAASVDVFSVVEDVGVMRIDHEWTVG